MGFKIVLIFLILNFICLIMIKSFSKNNLNTIKVVALNESNDEQEDNFLLTKNWPINWKIAQYSSIIVQNRERDLEIESLILANLTEKIKILNENIYCLVRIENNFQILKLVQVKKSNLLHKKNIKINKAHCQLCSPGLWFKRGKT